MAAARHNCQYPNCSGKINHIECDTSVGLFIHKGTLAGFRVKPRGERLVYPSDDSVAMTTI